MFLVTTQYQFYLYPGIRINIHVGSNADYTFVIYATRQLRKSVALKSFCCTHFLANRYLRMPFINTCCYVSIIGICINLSNLRSPCFRKFALLVYQLVAYVYEKRLSLYENLTLELNTGKLNTGIYNCITQSRTNTNEYNIKSYKWRQRRIIAYSVDMGQIVVQSTFNGQFHCRVLCSISCMYISMIYIARTKIAWNELSVN